VTPSNVIVMVALPSFTHTSQHSHDQTGFLRTLATPTWTHPLPRKAIPLEPPNTISGEPAAGEKEHITITLYTYAMYIVLNTLTFFSIHVHVHVVLTQCQVSGVPGAMVVLYTSSCESTSEQVNQLTTILEHPLLASTSRKVCSRHTFLHP